VTLENFKNHSEQGVPEDEVRAATAHGEIPKSPTVSVIVPIYNVEKYLRQCLDSIVGQTLQDIEIILVNDGSTDGSLKVIHEYASRDSRIKVIDKKNEGGGSARNAAYPHITGKYAYFADPDDWLELDLCEKATKRIEETGADVVYFSAVREFSNGRRKPVMRFNRGFPSIRITPDHRIDLLRSCDAPWLKLWRTEFLLRHQILFSEGKRPHNDVVHSWKGCALAEKIAILDKCLYHSRRLRPGSYQATLDRNHLVIAGTMVKVEETYRKIGKFDEYRHILIPQKLHRFYRKYIVVPKEYREELGQLILASLSEEDRQFFPTLPFRVRSFYRMLEKHDIWSTIVFRFHDLLAQIERRWKTTREKQ